MILSRSYGFVFVKGRKVASTSVEMALSGLCEDAAVVSPITPVDEQARLLAHGRGARNYSKDPERERAFLEQVRTTPAEGLKAVKMPPAVFYNHMPLAEIAKKWGREALDLPAVCVERHPYAKVLSWANMELSYDAYRAGGEMRASPDALRAFLDKAFARKKDLLTVKNIDLYRRPDKAVKVKVLRYENLAEDYAAFVRSLGIADAPALPHAKKGVAGSLAPEEFLTRKQLDVLNGLFRDELEAFGYEAA